jgi:hypothetical protein
LLADFNPVLAVPNALRSANGDFARVQAIAGPRIHLKLRPELIQLQAICNPAPEKVYLCTEILFLRWLWGDGLVGAGHEFQL